MQALQLTNEQSQEAVCVRPNFCHCSFVYSTLSGNREARVRWGVAYLCAINAYLHTPESRPIERILHPHALRTHGLRSTATLRAEPTSL